MVTEHADLPEPLDPSRRALRETTGPGRGLELPMQDDLSAPVMLATEGRGKGGIALTEMIGVPEP